MEQLIVNQKKSLDKQNIKRHPVWYFKETISKRELAKIKVVMTDETIKLDMREQVGTGIVCEFDTITENIYISGTFEAMKQRLTDKAKIFYLKNGFIPKIKILKLVENVTYPKWQELN